MIEGDCKQGFIRLPVTLSGECIYYNAELGTFALEKDCAYLVQPSSQELKSIARLVAQWREYRDTPTSDIGVSKLHLGALLGLERVC